MKPRLNNIELSLLCLIFFVVGYSSAQAESKSEDKWHFQIAPYAWLAGQNGKVATLPGLPPADVDVDFTTISGGISIWQV